MPKYPRKTESEPYFNVTNVTTTTLALETQAAVIMRAEGYYGEHH